MLSILVALVTLACVSLGVLIGLRLRGILPEEHLKDDSRDILKTAAGLIATLVALVLGLLVGSTKNSFDAANAGLMQAGAKIIALDRHLARYGPETAPQRALLKATLRGGIERMWPGHGPGRGDGDPADAGMAGGLERLHGEIVALVPADDARKAIQSQAMQVSNDLLQSRWLLVEQTQYALPTPFLVVLISWLTVLYASFGLLAPRNPTALAALFVCAVSISGAIFLILELNHPFDGTIKVSSLPFEKALSLLGH